MRKQRLPLYIPVLAVIAIVGFVVSESNQLYADEIKDWLDTSYVANPLMFVGIAAVVFVILFIGAIWVYQQQQQPSDAASVESPSVTPYSASWKLSDDLRDDPDARGFILAVRTQEYAEVQKRLLRPPEQTWWQALLYRLSFRRFCRPTEVPVAVVTGIGGIGKTALGLRVSYEPVIKSTYHHGRFYFDAAGIYPQYANNSTAQVLYRFLTGSGISTQVIDGVLDLHASTTTPEHVQHVQAWLEEEKDNVDITNKLRRLYRQFLEGQKRLVILDNPPDTMDVSDFEPPAGNALLLISRPGLNLHKFSTPDPLRLGKFDDAAARRLLEREWPDGVSMVSRINRLSSGIPLVLIVLARTLNDEAANKNVEAAQTLLTELEQEHRKGGWLGARFLARLLPYSGALNRRTVADVFDLSYQRLTPPAQTIFRALAIFAGYDFSQEAAIAAGAGDEASFALLVNRGLVEKDSSQDIERYFLYDPIAEYARTLLHAHADEIQAVQERYLDYFLGYVSDQEQKLSISEDAEEAAVLFAALRRNLTHVQVCRAMLHDAAPDDLRMAVRRLRLALPTLALMQYADDTGQPDQSWFPASTANEWDTSASTALEQIWAELDESARIVFASASIIPIPFDLVAASKILAPIVPTIDPQCLERLVDVGLLYEPSSDRYDIKWPRIQQRAQQAFAALSTATQQAIQHGFARYYAQRATEFFNEPDLAKRQVLFAQHWHALEKGQAVAAHAIPHLDAELVRYALQCSWYLIWQRDYQILTDWLEVALEAAQRRCDSPAIARLSLNRGIVADRQQQWATAQQWYEQARTTDGATPDTVTRACHGLGEVAWQQGQCDIAQHWYQQALNTPGTAPDTLASVRLGMGVVAERQQQWATAQQWFEQARTTDGAAPDTIASACHGLGFVAREQQQWATAQQWVEQARTTNGAAPATIACVCYGLGELARQQGQLEAAQQWYEQARATPGADPATIANACLGLGIVAYQQADYVVARDYYTRAIALNPGFAAAYRNCGLAWAKGDTCDYQQALVDAHLALILDPTFQSARDDIERYQQKLNQPPEDTTGWRDTALASPQRLDELSAIARLCLDRGILAERQQQWDSAQQWYQRVLDIPGTASATTASACHGLGVVAYKQADYAAARDYYTRAIALNPGLTVAYRNRGLAWAKGDTCDYQQALADARQAVELDPNFQAARDDIERYQREIDQQSDGSP